MKNRKIVFAFAILMTNALFAQKTHFQMSSLRPDADSAFTCRVTAKYDNGRFVQYTEIRTVHRLYNLPLHQHKECQGQAFFRC